MMKLMELTDLQILHIFKETARRGGPGDDFLHFYSEAITRATRKDFMVLRPASLLLIGKYQLEPYLDNFTQEVAEHNFPSSRRTA